MTIEFALWYEGVPIIPSAGSPEFRFWFEDVPYLDLIYSTYQFGARRRCCEY